MKKNVIVILKKNITENKKLLIDKLCDNGLIINQFYDYGVISGVLEEEKFELVRSLGEVQTVEEDPIINIPPPNEDIQ